MEPERRERVVAMLKANDTSELAERRFLKSAMAEPMLEAAHEASLARRWRDANDEAALHELTRAYMRLVIAMAKRFRHYGLPMADLISEGNVGLMLASARFDPDREVRFSTYASWWIRSQMQDYVLRNWSIVRTGTTAAQKSLFFNLRRLRARIDGPETGNLQPAQRTWIASHLRVSERDVEAMASRLSAGDRSLNAVLGPDSDTEAQDLIADEAPEPQQQAETVLDGERRRAWIADAFGVLDAREIEIVQRRAMADEPQTLEDLGRHFKVSKERIRQIERAALTKLRAALERSVGDPHAMGLLP